MIFRHSELPNPEQVRKTIDNSGIDKEQILILGGGTLAIFGIRYAHDADIMVPRATHTLLMQSGMTPSGLPLERKKHSSHGFLHTPPNKDQFLGLDIAPAYTPEYPDLMVDTEFLEFIKTLPDFDGYHYLTLDIVRAHKQHVGSGKHKRDIKLIDAYLNSQKV